MPLDLHRPDINSSRDRDETEAPRICYHRHGELSNVVACCSIVAWVADCRTSRCRWMVDGIGNRYRTLTVHAHLTLLLWIKHRGQNQRVRYVPGRVHIGLICIIVEIFKPIPVSITSCIKQCLDKVGTADICGTFDGAYIVLNYIFIDFISIRSRSCYLFLCCLESRYRYVV